MRSQLGSSRNDGPLLLSSINHAHSTSRCVSVQCPVCGARFASRGDDSGTHKKEVALWAAAGLDPQQASGTWYLETGSGMGATLNTAIGMGAYTMTDRATWISFAIINFLFHVSFPKLNLMECLFACVIRYFITVGCVSRYSGAMNSAHGDLI